MAAVIKMVMKRGEFLSPGRVLAENKSASWS